MRKSATTSKDNKTTTEGATGPSPQSASALKSAPAPKRPLVDIQDDDSDDDTGDSTNFFSLGGGGGSTVAPVIAAPSASAPLSGSSDSRSDVTKSEIGVPAANTQDQPLSFKPSANSNAMSQPTAQYQQQQGSASYEGAYSNAFYNMAEAGPSAEQYEEEMEEPEGATSDEALSMDSEVCV